MNTLHILDGFHAAGIEKQAFEIINHLPKNGNKNFLFNILPEIKDLESDFKNLLIQKKLEKIENLNIKSPFFLIYSIYKFCKKNRVDSLIIYPCNKKIIYVILGAKLARTNNIFIQVQNVIATTKKLEIIKLRLLFMIFNILGTFLVPASKSIYDSLIKLKIKNYKIQTIYNSCDTDQIKKISDLARIKYKSYKTKNIIMIARLDTIKDQETLLKAFAKLKKPYWNLKIVGQGPKLSYLRNLCLKLSLNPDEIFIGITNNVGKLLGESEIFAFSTTELEGFGKVLIEAMAANLPIIASDVSACREILLEGKAGILVPPGDVKSWEKNLNKLIENYHYRVKLKENLKELVKIYDSKEIAIQWESLLKRELKNF